jgi:hypothetical protein
MTCRTRKMRTAPLLVAALVALAAPAASAAPVEQMLPSVTAGGDDGAVPIRVVSVESERAFDWGDAGIGATGALALALMSGGVALATGHRVRRVSAT